MVQRLAVRIFRIFSDLNPWIDYILIINKNGLKGGPEEENIISMTHGMKVIYQNLSETIF